MSCGMPTSGLIESIHGGARRSRAGFISAAFRHRRDATFLSLLILVGCDGEASLSMESDRRGADGGAAVSRCSLQERALAPGILSSIAPEGHVSIRASTSTFTGSESTAPCTIEPALVGVADDLAMRISPILFVPRDLPTSGSAADPHDAMTDRAERFAQSLRRVQSWISEAAGNSRGLAIDRVEVVSGAHGVEHYLEVDSDGAAAPLRRVAEEWTWLGKPLVSEQRHQLVIGIGMGAAAGRYESEAASGAFTFLGDAFLDAMPEPRITIAGEANRHGGDLEAGDLQAGDRLMLAIVLDLLGVDASLLTKIARAGDRGLSSTDSASLRETVAHSAFVNDGILKLGALELATDDELIGDLAIGGNAVLALWYQPTDRVPREQLPRPPATTDDAYWVGVQNARLMARVVRIDGGSTTGGAALRPTAIVSDTPPIRGADGRLHEPRPDGLPAAAYDPVTDRFLVVWTRLVDVGGSTRSDFYARLIDADSGLLVGGERLLATHVGPASRNNEVDLARVGARFVFAVARGNQPINGSGDSLATGAVEVVGDTINMVSGPREVATRAKWPRMDSDGDRALLSYTGIAGRINDLFAVRLGSDGSPVGDRITLVEEHGYQGFSDVTRDPETGRWTVAFWENGSERSPSWDVWAMGLAASGVPDQPARRVASGPRRYQYDPSIAFVPAAGRQLVAYGDDAGPDDDASAAGGFFDGITRIAARLLGKHGRPEGDPVQVHMQYDAHIPTETVAHPSLPLAFVLHSGRDGVHLEVIHVGPGTDPGEDGVRVFGQIDLRETGYNEVVPDRVFHPAGVLVDRLPAPAASRLYVWDGGNNRVLGLDHVATCVGGAKDGARCTENSICGDGICSGPRAGPVSVVIGQPSGTNHSACNGDNTRLAAPDADTLCSVPYPYQLSPLEGPRGAVMATDGNHALYLVDAFNNRVLRYDDPFAADSTADRVWGQADFEGELCNRGLPAPTAETICTGERGVFLPNFYFSGGVSVSADGGTLWIADLGNHRVLRVPTGRSAADLVIGQPNMTSREARCSPPYEANYLCKPNAVAYDERIDRLYVLDGDAEHARLLAYDHPTTHGQTPSAIYPPPAGSRFFWARGLTVDPGVVGAVWVSDTDSHRIIQYVNGVPTKVLSKGDLTSTGCLGGLVGDGEIYPQVCSPHGSIGFDRDGSIYASDLQEQHVERFPAPIPALRSDGVAHSADLRIFYRRPDQANHHHINQVGPSGLANPGYALFVGDQLVIADRRRMLFWNDYAGGSPAAGPASGVLAQPDFATQSDPAITHHRDVVALAHDRGRQILYAAHGTAITAFDTVGGLHSLDPPLYQIQSPLPLHGREGQIDFEPGGIALDPEHDAAWVTDFPRRRLIRIIDFSRDRRRVDAVVGQPDLASTGCNRGAGVDNVVRGGFCDPTQVVFDRRGDLYVVDGTWEGREGNRRVVAFDRSDLPAVPSPTLTWSSGGPTPRRVYGKPSFTTRACAPDDNAPCTPRFLSFEPGTNRMVMTVDGYGNPLGHRVFVYDDGWPTSESAPTPTAVFDAPFNQAAASDWDATGRLVILDHTWNRALLFRSGLP